MFKLIIEDDEGHTTVVPMVKDEITIGRKEGNSIRLTERNVSRHHARMIRSNGSVFIEDLDSYNGVKVNGGRITARTSIREGDLVEIGDYHLALQYATEAKPELPKTPPPPPPPIVAKPPESSAATLRLPLEEKVPSPQVLALAAGPVENRTRTIAEDNAARLVVLNTEFAGQVYLLTSTEVTIGRTEENTISIPHRSVSSRHARIVYDGGVYRIIDLDSANGVIVNGEEYARVDIRKGDVVELGHIKLRCVSPDEDIDAIVAQVQIEEPSNPSLDVVPVSAPTPAEYIDIMPDNGRTLLFPGAIILIVLLAVGGLWYLLRDTGPSADASAVGAGTLEEKRPTPPPGASAIDESSRPSDVAGTLRQATLKIQLGEWDQAEQVLQTVLNLEPGNKDALSMRETIQKELEAAVALRQAKAAIEKMEWDEAMDRLSAIGNGLRASAEADALRPEVKKKYSAFHLNKADKLEKLGKLPEVLKELDAVLVVDENNPVVAEKRDALVKRMETPPRKKPVRIERPSEEPAFAQDEAQARELRQKGIDAYKKNQFADAVKFYQLALKLNPHDSDLYRFLGSTYARMGNREKAYEAYKKYVQVCPKCPYTPPIRAIIKEYEELQ